MASPDFAQKLLHDLRLRKQRMANTQNTDMYCSSSKNLKGSREPRTLEVGPKAGSRYRTSSNTQKNPAKPQSTNQIVPYGEGHHSGQVSDLSMALAYAFDNKGKLKRLDIASNAPMMNLLQQIGRKSTQQSFNIQWQSTNQFPTLTNLHINEISKGAQKLNQLLRDCSTGGININKGSIEIGKELWKGAMELEHSLRMLVSLQEASTQNITSPQQKSRLTLLDDNGESEDDSAESLEKQKQVECPVFSFDKPSKNNKVSVQRLTVHTQLENGNPTTERHLSITSSTPHRRTASCGSELNTPQLTNSSTSKHNAARLPNVIAKLMGIEELPQRSSPHNGSSPHNATENSACQQRSRDSVSTHTSPRSSKSDEVKIESTRPAKKPANQIGVQSNIVTVLTSRRIEQQEVIYKSTKNHYTAHEQEKPYWRLEERQGITNYVQESKTAISKINELQTKTMNLNPRNKTQNDIRKETQVKSMKEKQAAAIEISQGFTRQASRSLNTSKTMHADTLGSSNRQETKEEETSNCPPSQQKQRQSVELQHTHMVCKPHGNNLKTENRSLPKGSHRTEHRISEKGTEKMQTSKIIARDTKILQKQLPARKAKAGMKSIEAVPLAGPKMTEKRATSYIEAKSEAKKIGDTKAPKMKPTVKPNKESTSTEIAPRVISRELKLQEKALKLEQSKLDKITVSREAKLGKESISKPTKSTTKKDESSHPPASQKSQENEDVDQMDSRDQNLHNKLSEHEVMTTTLGDMGVKNISNIYDDHQGMSDHEVEVRTPVTKTDGQHDCKVNSSHQQKPIKVENQKPLTEDERFLKQKLIQSHIFLNTAEALFKLNIPISILNYASEQICEARDSKIILDCGYELLQRKGRREVDPIYPSIKNSVSYAQIKSLDDLVRLLHKDFEALRIFGNNEVDAYDYANSIVKMLESDIYNKHPDLNSMWENSWSEMFSSANMDDVICNIEQLILDELMVELFDYCL